ncbi:MAG: nitronate monooxygenase [Aestuariivita sp.]
MWPDRRLTDLLGIEHPILQAPMLGSCTPELAAAVTGAGGLGAHACGTLPADEVRARARAVRALTNGAYNLNLFVLPANAAPAQPGPQARAVLEAAYARAGLELADGDLPPIPAAPDPEVIDALVETAPPVVSFHFGLPDAVAMDRLRAAGIRIFASATCVAEALRLERAGVDAVIAQGWEAGGHRGSFTPGLPADGVATMALVPQIADAVSVPVIAAGGIADARGIAAALALGASGVQMGTAFLRCPEAATDPRRRARLAGADDSGTTVTDAVSGRSARGARSAYAADMAPLAGTLAPFPAMYALLQPLLEAGAGEMDAYASFDLFGQAAALGGEEPAADLVARLARETRERLGWLGHAT